MDAKEIERLREEQLAAITQTEERITKLEKFKNDYRQLKERLGTLPDKVSYDVMVPFGKLAFMPGRLVHTNEITLLLGDNWFAEVSAKDAIGITGQRVTDIDRQIAELNKQKSLLQPRVDFTSELQGISENAGGLVEIKEEYDAEKEKAWRERHAENVRRHKQGTGKGENREATGEDVWKRLEELETRELARDELRSSQSEESDEGGRPCARKKSVTWEDERGGTSTSSEDSSGEDREEQGMGSVIHFSHSKPAHESQPSDSSSDRDDDAATFRSPADIYKRYIETRPAKSILRTSAKSRQHAEATPLITTPACHATSDRAEAFSGEVIERGSGDVAETLPTGHLVRTSVTTHDQEQVTRTEIIAGNLPQLASVQEQIVQQDTGLDSHKPKEMVAQAQPKRVSKFRAQRMQHETNR